MRVVALSADQPPRWVAIDKPAGLLSVPGKGPAKQDCAAARIRTSFPHARGPLVVHRLDMDTSGLLLFGLDEHAQRDLSLQFENREVTKAYTAIVAIPPRGLSSESGVLDAPMRLDLDRRPYQVIDHAQGRPALTRWRLLAIEPGGLAARLRLEPLTGRTHQLRVHLAHAHMPILGDVLYAPPSISPTDRLMLHASELTFRDPTTRLPIALTTRTPF